MNIVLLSGGSGKRLWPLSNDIRSKQFIKIFRNDDGSYDSMVQRMYRGITRVDKDASISIATSKSQVSAIHNQLGEKVGISVEPCRRDTFPAIALATMYLHDVKGVGENEAVVVCPCDPFVEDDYFEALDKLSELAEKAEANLCLLGMEPTYPSEKYGYIVPESTGSVSRVVSFTEKPDLETSKKLIASKALWNGGVFAFKCGYMMRKAHDLMDFTDYQDLYDKYDSLDRISFDYAIAEKEKNIAVMRFSGQWKDLGTWNTLSEAMQEPVIGNAIIGDNCENVNIINELSTPILCMGVKNMVVSASPQGILVSDKGESSYIRKYVDKIDDEVMFAEKSWGTYRVLNIDAESMMIMDIVNAGASMSYHSHAKRKEVWTVIYGSGTVIVDGVRHHVQAGDVVTMEPGSRHTVIAETEMKLFELQLGLDGAAVDKSDKTKYTEI